MNESITRAAGAGFGQEWPPEEIEEAIRDLGRTPRMRTTLYGDAAQERRAQALQTTLLQDIENLPAGKLQRSKRLRWLS